MRRALVATACFILAAAPARAQGPQAQHERMVNRHIVRSGVHFIDLTPGVRLPVSIGLKAPPAPVVNSRTTGPSTGGGGLSASQVAAYARAAGFPESVIPTMVAIAYRESHWIPAAVNPSSGACGLWQLYPCPGPAALGPMVNAQLAYAKYRAAGLSPWGG